MLESNSKLTMLHAVELAMLEECIRICDRHDIRYFLIGGSALGAVRHSGIIPWDDDIDVGMPRPDYERFLAVAQAELDTDHFLQTHETDPFYPMPFAKIRNSRTAFIQPSVSSIDMNHGVSIDVFPLDGFPANPVAARVRMFIFRVYRASILCKLGVRHGRLPFRVLVRTFSAPFSLSRLREKIDRLMKKDDYEQSDAVVNWGGAWGLKEAVPKDFFGEGRRVEFEGMTATIPGDSDGYLKSLYGDYMTVPPIDERVTRHTTDVIDLERSYAEHVGDRVKRRQ